MMPRVRQMLLYENLLISVSNIRLLDVLSTFVYLCPSNSYVSKTSRGVGYPHREICNEIDNPPAFAEPSHRKVSSGRNMDILVTGQTACDIRAPHHITRVG